MKILKRKDIEQLMLRGNDDHRVHDDGWADSISFVSKSDSFKVPQEFISTTYTLGFHANSVIPLPYHNNCDRYTDHCASMIHKELYGRIIDELMRIYTKIPFSSREEALTMVGNLLKEFTE